MQKVGQVRLVLGPGLAPGLASFGVLVEFSRACVPIVEVIGVNTGAIAAALWATESDLDLAARLIGHLPWTELGKGGSDGSNDSLLELLELLTQHRTFEETRRRVAVVARRRCERRATVFRTGSIAQAVRGSIALPGLFHPVTRGGEALVDAGADWRRAVCQDPHLQDDAIQVWTFFLPSEEPTNPTGKSMRESLHFEADDVELASYISHTWLAVAPSGAISVTAGVRAEELLAFEMAEEWVGLGRRAARDWLRRIKVKQG